VVEEGLIADGDPTTVKLILQNLIENAVKFSPGGGAITIGRLPDGARPFFCSRRRNRLRHDL
jgi:signal transduction histidine kinase